MSNKDKVAEPSIEQTTETRKVGRLKGEKTVVMSVNFHDHTIHIASQLEVKLTNKQIVAFITKWLDEIDLDRMIRNAIQATQRTYDETGEYRPTQFLAFDSATDGPKKSIRVPVSLRKRLEECAIKIGASKSEVVRIAVTECLFSMDTETKYQSDPRLQRMLSEIQGMTIHTHKVRENASEAGSVDRYGSRLKDEGEAEVTPAPEAAEEPKAEKPKKRLLFSLSMNDSPAAIDKVMDTDDRVIGTDEFWYRIKDEELRLKMPYRSDLPDPYSFGRDARQLNGTWSKGSKEWVFAKDREEEVLGIVRYFVGWAPGDSVAPVRITATRELRETNETVDCGTFPIVQALEGTGLAMSCRDVTHISGEIWNVVESRRKNYNPHIEEGAVFEINCFPTSYINDRFGWKIEVLDAPGGNVISTP